MREYLQVSVSDHKRASLQALQDRIRNPSLTVLLLLQLFLLFVALPLDARGAGEFRDLEPGLENRRNLRSSEDFA
jgi:hypothetical protein